MIRFNYRKDDVKQITKNGGKTMKKTEREIVKANLLSIIATYSYKLYETEDYFEIYSKDNPFPSLTVWHDDYDSVTVKTRIDDDDLFFEEQLNGFDNAFVAFILLDKTTAAIAEQVDKASKKLFGTLIK